MDEISSVTEMSLSYGVININFGNLLCYLHFSSRQVLKKTGPWVAL